MPSPLPAYPPFPRGLSLSLEQTCGQGNGAYHVDLFPVDSPQGTGADSVLTKSLRPLPSFTLSNMAPLCRLAVVAVGWALLLGVTHASPYAFNPPRDLAASLLRSRDFDPQDCRQRMPSNPWDSCQDFLDRYKLTLPRFYHMNPEVETDCYNFIAGEEFCIASGQSTTPPSPRARNKTLNFLATMLVFRLAISTSGSCGLVNGVATTCVGSTFGECCGANGQYVLLAFRSDNKMLTRCLQMRVDRVRAASDGKLGSRTC